MRSLLVLTIALACTAAAWATAHDERTREQVAAGRDAQRHGVRSYDIRGIDAADSELRLVGDGGATRGMVELRRARGGFVAELAPAGGAASLTLRAEGESWSAGDGNGAAVDLAAASPAQSAAFALLVAVLADEAVQGKFPLVSRGEAIYVSCGNACSGCGTCAGAPADLHAAACNACAPCFTCVEAAAP